MKMKLSFLLTSVFVSFQLIAASQTMDITIKNIKPSAAGSIRIAFFGDEIGFKKEQHLFDVTCDKQKIKDGELNLKVPVKPGRYGLAVLDDVNNSAKMEYKMLAIPKKGFGFSNYKSKGLFKPKFSDFAFDIEPDEVKTVVVYMRYM